MILDSDLARIYGVTTKRLNEQVQAKCRALSATTLPSDLPTEETARLEHRKLRPQVQRTCQTNRSQLCELQGLQIATLAGSALTHLPHAFTEHGAIMAANVLNSKQAVQMKRLRSARVH